MLNVIMTGYSNLHRIYITLPAFISRGHCFYEKYSKSKTKIQLDFRTFTIIKYLSFVLFITISFQVNALDYYVSSSDLNIRSGPTTSDIIIGKYSKGDTITSIGDVNDIWIKVNHANSFGYCSKAYLLKVEKKQNEIVKKTDTVESEEEEQSHHSILLYFFLIIGFIILLHYIGERHRNKYIAAFLALVSGGFGMHKFYLGEIAKGIYSIIFCWTFIPLIVGLVDSIKFLFAKEMDFDKKFNGVKVSYKQINGKAIKQKVRYENVQIHDEKSNIPTATRGIPNFLSKTEIDSKKEEVDLSLENISSNKSLTQNSKFINEEIIKIAVNENPYDYLMQKLTYKRQVESKAFMGMTNDEEIKEIAVKEYPNDYFMQEHTYKRQAESKAFMGMSDNEEIKEIAVKEYPNDYFMQEHTYKEQIKLLALKGQTKKNQVDDTIIDINSEELNLSVEKEESVFSIEDTVPSWRSFYVYSFDEIRYASYLQRKFYNYLKENVLNGKFIDIQGNTNYAFILYFDLLNEYENHKDIKLLEDQFKLIGQICPKTKNYTLNIFLNELRKRDDEYSVNKLNELNDPFVRFQNGYTDYNPFEYRLGSLYEEKLKLNSKETNWLNKIWHVSNVFLAIEACLIEVIRYYCFVLEELEKKWSSNDITNNITEIIKSSLIRKSDYFNDFESNIYFTIFKMVENNVRISFQHKRQLSDSILTKYSTRVQSKFDEFIGNDIREILERNTYQIQFPNLDTQIELNAQNTNRWKIEFNDFKDTFSKDDLNKFIEGILKLEKSNQKNPNIENIFFEASKFIAKYNKVQSLKYYAMYIYYDLKSKKFENQQLNTTIQKSLFSSNEQLVDFQTIIDKLIQNSNIEEALAEISNIFIPKRKKITLNISEINEVKKKHSNTVELLNEILENKEDEFEPSQNNLDDINEELVISFGEKTNANSLFKPKICLNSVQEQLVLKFVSNSFVLQQIEVETFAIKNGLFKIQLIDSINEICAKILDGEVLIEEDEDNYIIEQTYYQEILN